MKWAHYSKFFFKCPMEPFVGSDDHILHVIVHRKGTACRQKGTSSLATDQSCSFIHAFIHPCMHSFIHSFIPVTFFQPESHFTSHALAPCHMQQCLTLSFLSSKVHSPNLLKRTLYKWGSENWYHNQVEVRLHKLWEAQFSALWCNISAEAAGEI